MRLTSAYEVECMRARDHREILSEDAGAAMLAKHGVKVVRNFSDPVKAESFYNDLEESVKTNQEAA